MPSIANSVSHSATPGTAWDWGWAFKPDDPTLSPEFATASATLGKLLKLSEAPTLLLHVGDPNTSLVEMFRVLSKTNLYKVPGANRHQQSAVILAVVLYMALLILVPPGRTSLSLYLSVQILPIRHVTAQLQRSRSREAGPGKPCKLEES